MVDNKTNATFIKRNKKPKQGWSIKWLDVEGFKGWLELDYTDHLSVYCTACKASPGLKLRARFSNLKDHALTDKHLKASNRQTPYSPEDFIQPKREDSKQALRLARGKLKAATVSSWAKLAPTKLNPFIKTMATIDDNKASVLSNMSIGATQCRDIIVNVVQKVTQEKLATWLRNHLFTACVDESTDRGNEKTFAIIVRYPDFDDRCIRTVLFDLVEVFDKNNEASATGARLAEIFKKSFDEHDVPLENLYALSCDNCDTMLGNKNGFTTQLGILGLSVICLGCAAHRTALCVKWAIQELPSKFMDLIKNIDSMLTSAHRKHNFKNLQEELDMIYRSMLKHKETRWLSLENVVIRILELWTPIFIMAEQLHMQNDATATKIFNLMLDPEMKCYFLLVKQALFELNSLNRLLQSDEVILHILKAEIDKRYKNIVSIILNRDYVRSTAASEIDVFNEDHYVAFKDLQVADEIKDTLRKNGVAMENFCSNAYRFVMALAFEMQERFNKFEIPLYEAAACLDPQNATNKEYHKQNPQIFDELLEACELIVGTNNGHRYNSSTLRKQWKKVVHLKVPKESRGIVDFWMYVYHDVGGFKELSEFILYALAIPHSNAAPERAFSRQNDIKTKKKTSMSNATLNAHLRVRDIMRERDVSCWEPDPEMTKCVAKGHFYKKKTNDNK